MYSSRIHPRHHRHPPAGVFDQPHFDVHFYMTDMASVMAIDPASPEFAAKIGESSRSAVYPAGLCADSG